MSSNLYNQFDPVSSKQWKQKIQMDLKGADYNKTLVHATPEGINIKPFYHKDEFKSVASIPGHPNSWLVVQHVVVGEVTSARALIKEALSKGAQAIWLAAEQPFSIADLFSELDLKTIVFYTDFKFLDVSFYLEFAAAIAKAQGKLSLRLDIVGNYAETGNWFANNKEDHAKLAHILASNSGSVLGVNMELYANAGANAVQQLAYGVSHLNEYFNFLKNDQGTITANPKVCITVACNSNYFMEIAKLRALRVLVNSLGKEYDCTPELELLSTPALRNKTIYDPNVNMLRTTTECMSAVLGGANAICNLPYDSVYHKPNDFGERISRNQLLILKHESYFDLVSNAADGSYYIEELTVELAQNALELFKEIEAKGGFMYTLKAGTIQRKIKENANAEQQRFNKAELPLLGTNLFANTQEKIKETINVHPFNVKQARKTQIEPIIRKRIAQEHEKKRLDNE